MRVGGKSFRALAWLAGVGLLAISVHVFVMPRAHTVGPRLQSFTPPLALPGYGAPRQLRIYLPPDYAQATRRYPVIYLFDGQNLFDDATSFVGEWGVDETLDSLEGSGGFAAIAVGIDHGDAQRWHELTPYWNALLAPNQGDAFASDLVERIIPFVDANYRTLADRSDRAIAGSSLGGLEADYVIHHYPRAFSRAMVFSPSYWTSDEAFEQARRWPLPPDSRVYLYVGGSEGTDMGENLVRMESILRRQLPVPPSVCVRVVPGAEHNEAAWRAELPRALRWLFALPDANCEMPVP